MQRLSAIPTWPLPFNVLLALGVNVLMFFFIYLLVKPSPVELSKRDGFQVIDFIRFKQKIEEPVPPTRQPPPPPSQPPPKDQPLAPQLSQPKMGKPSAPSLQLPAPDIHSALRVTGGPYLGDYEPGPPSQGFTIELELDEDATPISRVPPLYPPQAQRASIEGTVTVELIINTDGSVADITILKADPPGIFNEAVARAVKKWRFRPKIKSGKAVPYRARQDVLFSLSKEG